MKKIIALMLAVLMMAAMCVTFASCGQDAVELVAIDATDLLAEDFGIAIKKGNTALLEAVNAVLAKAMAANLYDGWYEVCQIYSEVKTADQLGYDDYGNKKTEE